MQHTPITLWQDYDRFSLPLNTNYFKTEKKNGYKINHVYFNGDKTDDGLTRIYGKVFIPEKSNGGGVVLFNDASDPYDTNFSEILVNRGYTVILADYLGKNEGETFTIYPESLAFSNYFKNKDCIKLIPSEPINSCWYVWASVMNRSITFLETECLIKISKISLIGIRLGGFSVYKSAFVNKEISSAVALYNSARTDFSENNSDESSPYFSSLDSAAYASLITCPFLVQVSSNAEDGTTDIMSDVYTAAENENFKFSISDYSNDLFNERHYNNVIRFVEYWLTNKEPLKNSPEVKFKNSEGVLYISVKTNNEEVPELCNLFFSYESKNPAHRSWRKLNLTSLGEGEYFAKMDIYNAEQPVYAFVNIRFGEKIILSSNISTVTPKVLLIKAKELVKSRLIYDTEQGYGDFLILKNANRKLSKITLKEGAHEIEGITSLCNSISLFKIGEDSYKGNQENVLQFLIYSETNQKVKFIVSEDGEIPLHYISEKQITADGEWQRITVDTTSLRSEEEGSLENWDNVYCLTIDSESELLINSVIWI